MRKLLLILFCIPLFAQVPNTSTFTMRDVADEIGVSYSGRTLTSLFNLANESGFDPAYVGSKNSLLNFRNYSHVSGLRYEGINLVAPDARGIYIDDDGEWLAYVVDGAVKTVQLSTAWDISSASNTYTYNTSQANAARGVVFASQGLHMYIVRNDRQISHSHVDVFYRPDLGTDFIESSVLYSEAFFISEAGTKSVRLDLSGNPSISEYTFSTPYDLTTSNFEDSMLFNQSTVYGVYNQYQYVANINANQGVDIGQYITPFTYVLPDTQGTVYVSKTVQFLPPISSIRSIYPAPSGDFLYLNAVGTDGIRRIWQITMSGTNIL